MIQNKYLEQAIKDEVLKYLESHRSIKKIQILDICKISEFEGKIRYNVLVKHKMITKNKYCICNYNCTAFAIMSYTDWTLSTPDEIGTVLHAGDGFWNELWYGGIMSDDGNAK